MLAQGEPVSSYLFHGLFIRKQPQGDGNAGSVLLCLVLSGPLVLTAADSEGERERERAQTQLASHCV